MRRLILLPLLAATACGTSPATSAAPGDDRPPAVSAAPTLLPDGTVPWVDEPAGLREYDLQLPPAPSVAGAQPCRADQLEAVLPRWRRQGDGGEPGVRRPPPGLIGQVEVALRGDRACTLQGTARVRLLVDGAPAPVQYSDRVAPEAERRTTTVTAERGAGLRLDWSPPYCAAPGAQELVVGLPDDGGELRVPVREPATPPCTGSPEGDRGLRTVVSGGVFEPAPVPTPLDSPLAVLRATAEQVPATARAGNSLDWVVRLTNPTATAVALDPCPGQLLESLVQSTGDAAGVNTSTVYRLNCRPVREVPAGGSVAFQVRVPVPAAPPGPVQSVAWRLLSPRLAGEDGLRVGFTVPLA